MTDSTTIFEVQRTGEKPRRFCFEEAQITIGFSPDCDVCLEPEAADAAELMLSVQGETGCLIHPTCQPGAFLLNETPCAEPQAIKPGDVISAEMYRIRI